MSSNAALQSVKRLFQARKAGHTGSLDPLASGLLPICFGEATKLSAFLLDADKRYTVTARLGRQTATGDLEGPVIRETAVPVLDNTQIEQVLSRFIGEQRQIPPMYSALKHQGRRLYALARAGVEVERPARNIRIGEIRLLDRSMDSLELEILCSKGTYIRTLVEDIALGLGSCAHVETLRRLATAHFGPEGMLDLTQLERLAAQGLLNLDAVLLPVDSALQGWPEAELDAADARRLQCGQSVQSPYAAAPGLLSLYGPAHHFLGIGVVTEEGRIVPRRLLQPAIE